MSKMLSERIKVALSVLVAAGTVLFVPASTSANTCSVMAKSFRCMSGAVQKKPVVKPSYKVASVSPTATIRDVGPSVIKSKPVSKPAKKVRSKKRSVKKSKAKRRSVRKRKIARRSKKIVPQEQVIA